jgi:hypothetical protein
MRGERRRICARLCLLAVAILVGCKTLSEEAKRDGINAVNEEFKKQYEETLEKNGTHVVGARPDDAFNAIVAALVKLGFVVHQQSRDLGVVSVEAPAPSPLDRNEFDSAAALDLPKTKELLRPYLGVAAEFFHFDTKGLDTVVTATIIGVRGGSEISFTMRMREVASTDSNLPRRDYPPPNVLRAGLDKVWKAVDRELAALGQRR